MINALAKAEPKGTVSLTFLNMTRDRHSDDLRDRLSIHGCNHVQFLGLVGRQSNCHCLDSLHSCIIGGDCVVVKWNDIVVS